MFEIQRKKAVSLANRHLIGFEEKMGNETDFLKRLCKFISERKPKFIP